MAGSFRLARRPVHRASAQHMDVQVIDRLAAIRACIDDGSVAIAKAFAPRYICGNGQHVAQQRRVVVRSVRQRLQVLARNDEKVRRCLRRDVAKRNHLLVLVELWRGNLVVGDFAEDAIHTVSIESRSALARVPQDEAYTGTHGFARSAAR